MHNGVPARGPAPDNRKRMFVAILKSALVALVMAVVLFLVAGRWDWIMGWVYTGLVLLSAVASVLAAGPDLLAERSAIPQGAKRWDVPLSILVARVGPLVTVLVAALDERMGWSSVAAWLQWVSVVVALLSMAFAAWAMAVNRFFSAVVRIQADRGHQVVTGGPYRFVRHPGYAGSVLFQLATPLILGSLWALIPAALTVAVLVLRTAREDRTLQAELEGYMEYAHRVRYRLLPGVW